MTTQQQEAYVLEQAGWTENKDHGIIGGSEHRWTCKNGYYSEYAPEITRAMIHDLLMEEKEVECYSTICEDGKIIDRPNLKCAECNGTGKVKVKVRDYKSFTEAVIKVTCGEVEYEFELEWNNICDMIFSTTAQLITAMNMAFNEEWSE